MKKIVLILIGTLCLRAEAIDSFEVSGYVTFLDMEAASCAYSSDYEYKYAEAEKNSQIVADKKCREVAVRQSDYSYFHTCRLSSIMSYRERLFEARALYRCNSGN